MPNWHRIPIAVLFVIAIFCSLIVYSEFLLWMILFWLCAAGISSSRGTSIWPYLLIPGLVLIFKRVGWTPALFILLATLLIAAVISANAFSKRQGVNRRIVGSQNRFLLGACVIAATWYGLSRFQDANVSRMLKLDKRPIICLGDSLTSFGYPQELAKLLSVPILNFGREGIFSGDGVNVLPEIITQNPQAVVIELGGHDYNSGGSRAMCYKNLANIISTLRTAGIEPVLVEIPRGFIADPFDGIERELAAELDVQLIADTPFRNFVFLGPVAPPGIWLSEQHRFSDDGLHPNANGNRHLANAVVRGLARVFGSQIIRKP